ncbi:MAG: di-trans,poly-cis-decaprenylcistransferase [Cytophagales bacterium]|jgi:undecaprenyl diphosphate synthase|nr:di-trans,poly-cis-decaprenylcistransferase [Cytophagales bacterium]
MKNYGFLICSFLFGLFAEKFFLSIKKYFYYRNVQITNTPKHIAVIMDGNGRWAQKKGQPRTFGHKNSVASVESTIATCLKYNIKFLTLYAFSTENWERPQKEIDEIFNLINDFIPKEKNRILENKIKINVLGDIGPLPEALQKNLTQLIEKTKNNDKLILNVCLNYSGRWDIINAFNKILQNKKVEKIDYEEFSHALSTANIPDPDIIIRTGGDMRISNFLSWQCAYSEFFFLDKFWPDFTEKDFDKVLVEYQLRNRKFGEIK